MLSFDWCLRHPRLELWRNGETDTISIVIEPWTIMEGHLEVYNL